MKKLESEASDMLGDLGCDLIELAIALVENEEWKMKNEEGKDSPALSPSGDIVGWFLPQGFLIPQPERR